jgi:8-oxo-dGTP pyrophosphatase MutT (NUDIX family)
MSETTGHRVLSLKRCELGVSEDPWPFAEDNRAAIEAHWARRKAENPHFFNGQIHLLREFVIEGECLSGRLLRTDFKSFLFWRETGERDRSVLDAFGSALIRSRDGAIVLGCQRAGNINAGLSYLPGGFIDARDVDASGLVDIRASVLREVTEETGLTPADLSVGPNYLVTFCGQQVSIAVEIRASCEAAPLVSRIRRYLESDPSSELEDVVVVRTSSDVAALAVPAYARALLKTLLTSPPASR